jgi:hypothetical protein
MTKRLAVFAAALLACSAVLAEEGVYEKTISFPRRHQGDVGITYLKCTIRSLEARNYPDEEDIEKARANDPKDQSWIWWEFDVANRGPEKLKIKLVVEVLDKGGQVVKSSDRGVTIDGFEDETYKLMMHMRTLDAADSPKVRVRASFVHDKK